MTRLAKMASLIALSNGSIAQMIAIADRVLSMRDGNLLASTEEPA